MHPANLIAGESLPIPGDSVRSHNPAHPERTIWSGSPRTEHVDQAVAAAHAALPAWRNTPLETRIDALRAFQRIATERVEAIADLICDETGKPIWDSLAEARLLSSKVDITLDDSRTSGRARVTDFVVPISDSRTGRCRFRPHGVAAVIGPFNFPAHLPNGHIVPALLTGNTVVFKPSDKAPGVGQLLASLYIEALDSVGAPAGVVNLVHGGADVATRLTTHPDIDAILFTGSWPVGRRILEANLDNPGRLIALEMGGNNPAVVLPDADLRQTAVECARAAFVSTGQRCTCTRRLIVHRDIAPKLLPLLAKVTSNLIIGDPRGIGAGARNQSVFMGPIIRAEAREALLCAQQSLLDAGAQPIIESTAMEHPSGGHYVTPAILRVERFTDSDDATDADAGGDVEIFGPLLRVSITDSLDDAIAQANATRFGLAAAIFTNDESAIDRFLDETNAGCINVNTGTAGASSKLPFGGLGRSGNHRPAGAFSLDYTAAPIASLIETGPEASLLPGMRYDDAWLK